MWDEKRKHLRLLTGSKVRLTPFDITSETVAVRSEQVAYAQNVSAGGLLLHSPCSFPINSLTRIRMEFPLEIHPMDMVGEVRHQTRRKREAGFDVGISFLKISSSDRKKLQHLQSIF